MGWDEAIVLARFSTVSWLDSVFRAGHDAARSRPRRRGKKRGYGLSSQITTGDTRTSFAIHTRVPPRVTKELPSMRAGIVLRKTNG